MIPLPSFVNKLKAFLLSLNTEGRSKVEEVNPWNVSLLMARDTELELRS